RLLVKDRTETITVISNAPTVISSKSRDLFFAPVAVVWPDAVQFIVINGTMLRRLKLLLDLIGKLPHVLETLLRPFWVSCVPVVHANSKTPDGAANDSPEICSIFLFENNALVTQCQLFGNQTFCGSRTETKPMNKYTLCLITALIGMASIVSSCQQQGTTATTKPAVTAASPTPTPRARHKSTGAAKRNPPKTEGSAS